MVLGGYEFYGNIQQWIINISTILEVVCNIVRPANNSFENRQ